MVALTIREQLALAGVAVTVAVTGGLGLVEKPVLDQGAQRDRTCRGSKTVTWTDAIMIYDPLTGRNSKVEQFKRTGIFPCFVPKDSPGRCVRANPQNTEVIVDEFGTRLRDNIPLTANGCGFVSGRRGGR